MRAKKARKIHRKFGVRHVRQAKPTNPHHIPFYNPERKPKMATSIKTRKAG